MAIWTVPAAVVRIIDGDTVVLDLDLGWGVHRPLERCRLARVNCPELKTDGQPNEPGLAAMEFTAEWLRDRVKGTWLPLTFVSRRLDNYGRPLGEIIRADKRNLGDDLLAAGHAVPM